MAKLVVLFFAALAFHAALAGVRRHHHHHHHKGLEDGRQFEGLVGQIQGVTRDLSVTLEDVLPNNRQVYKTLTWQYRELAQCIDDIINRLKLESGEYNGSILDPIVSELREIQVQLKQTGEYTDASNVNVLKNQLNTYVQNAAEQIEKLVRLVPTQTDIEQTQGGLQVTLKDVLNDFYTTVQNIQTQLQYVGIQGQQTPKQLAVQIQDCTTGLVGYLQGTYLNTQQIRLALREYVQNVEGIISRLQTKQGTYGNVEFDTVIQQITDRLRKVLVPVMQITDAGATENVDILKTQLIREFDTVAEELMQLVQYTPIGSQQTLVQDVLYDYLTTLQQAKIQIQGGYQGLDLYGGYKYGLGKDGLLQRDLLMGKLDKYGKSGKGLETQMQVVVNDLVQTLQTVYLDNTLLRQTLVGQFREYIQVLETIVERLEQVKYDAAIDVKNVQKVVLNLREIVLTLRKLCGDVMLTMPVADLRSQLCLCVQNFGIELQKLVLGGQYGIQQIKGTTTTTTVWDVLVHYLIATRNLQTQLQNVYFPQRGQTTTGFGIQIQTLANGLTTGLESVYLDNEQVRQVLIVQCRELAQQIETIIERLQGETIYKTGYGVEIPQQVAENLRHIVVTLRRLCGYEDFTNSEQLRMQLIICIQETATEIQRLLWVGQDYFQGQKVDGVLYDILRDFVVTLQNHQIQLQNVYQTRQYGQNTQQLAIQIQTITNNLAIFLQNVPADGHNLDIQVRKLVEIIEAIIDRLETEVIYTKETNDAHLVIENLKRIIASLERDTKLETTTYGLSVHLNLVLQNVAVELKKLAWIAQSDFEQIQGNLNTVVRSVLVQYLAILQRLQIDLQGINQTVQIGQTPRELALQIQIVANRLSGILRVYLPDNRQTQDSLIWQVRRFCQIIENIVDRLQVQITKGYGKVDLLQQVIYNLNQIRMSMQQVIGTGEVMTIQQLKIQLAVCIQDAAIEIQKLMWVAQSDLQGNTDVLVKGVLIDFLAGLHNLQMQIQSNLQIVLGGQNPRSLAMQIQSVANRLFAYLQWVQLQPNTQQLRQTLIIQIGEFTQTIENLIQMLRTEMKTNGENALMLQQILGQLTKISVSLQKVNGVEAKITVNELSSELLMHLRDVVVEIQRLAWIAQSKLEDTKLSYNGVLNGVLNNCLTTLRNMLIQFQNTQEIGQYGQGIKELASQIQIVTNKLTTSLQNVVTGTKQVKQTLAIQILKYARRISTIVDRLETEVSYDSGVNVDTLRQVAISLRQIVIAFQQVGESLMTQTTIDLKTQLTNYIQNVDAEIQKLLMIQSDLQQYKGVADTVVRSVLIEYLSAIQNLQIQVQYTILASQKGLTLQQLVIQIRAVVYDLSINLQRTAPTNKLVKEIFITEARQCAQVIANIINKLQVESVSVVGNNELFQQVAYQLKEVQLIFQRIAAVETIGDIYQQRIQLEIGVQRAIAIIEQLMWCVQPELQLTEASTGTVSLVREILNDFLIAVQNVDIQIQIVLQNGQTGQYYYGLEGARESQRLPVHQGLQELQYYGGYDYPMIGQPQLGPYERLYGGKYYGGLQGRQMPQTPELLINEIETMAKDLSMILQDTTFNGQQVSQILSVQARQFVQIIKNIIVELEGKATYYKVVDTTYQQVIDRLREVQMSLQRLAAYNTFTTVRQLKIQFDDCIRTIVTQIQRLVLVAQGETQGKWYVTIQNVLNTLCTGIRTIYYQLRDVTQYRQGFSYDYLNQYGKYDQGYGYDKYNQLYGKYDQGYGYGKYGKYDQMLGKYDQAYGKYDQGYGYGKYGKYDQTLGKYDQAYGKYDQGYGYGKYGKYDQMLGKYDQVYGKYDQGYGYEKYGKYDQVYGKYDQGYGYGKYGKYEQMLGKYDQVYGKYDQGYGYGKYGKYDQTLGKYDQSYGYGKYGKYDQTLGKYDQVYGKYDQGYGYGKYDQGYGKYNQLFGKYDVDQYKYGNQYGNVYGLLTDKYGYGLQGYGIKGQTCEQLVNEIRMVAGRIVDELQTVGTTDKQVKQILVIQARQLVQIVDNMIDRLQVEITNGNVNQYEIIRQVISNLRQIQIELRRIVTSGVITTVYQIRAQIVNNIENIVTELQRLVVIVKTDVQLTQAVKDVFNQYLVCLRSFYYQYQSNTTDLVSRLLLVVNKLVECIRDTPYNTIQVRECAQNIKFIINRMQSQLYMNKDYLPLTQVLYRLDQIVDAILREYNSGVIRYDVLLVSKLQDVVYEFQNWIRVAQPQLERGSQVYVNTFPVGVLGDFLRTDRTYQDTIRTY